MFIKTGANYSVSDFVCTQIPFEYFGEYKTICLHVWVCGSVFVNCEVCRLIIYKQIILKIVNIYYFYTFCIIILFLNYLRDQQKLIYMPEKKKIL